MSLPTSFSQPLEKTTHRRARRTVTHRTAVCSRPQMLVGTGRRSPPSSSPLRRASSSHSSLRVVLDDMLDRAPRCSGLVLVSRSATAQAKSCASSPPSWFTTPSACGGRRSWLPSLQLVFCSPSQLLFSALLGLPTVTPGRPLKGLGVCKLVQVRGSFEGLHPKKEDTY